MSTHSGIGVWTNRSKKEFKARYVQFDGYVKNGVGATLVENYKQHFRGNLQAMIDYLVTNEKVGWSTLASKDFTLPPTWQDARFRETNAPESYSVRGETPRNLSGDGDWITDYRDTEYLYIFDVSDNSLSICSTYVKNWVTINLDDDIFDASKIEQQIHEPNKENKKFVNLTNVYIKIKTDDGKYFEIAPSGGIATVYPVSNSTEEILNIPTILAEAYNVVGLPNMSGSGTYYIVNDDVFYTVGDHRTDVLTFGDTINPTDSLDCVYKSLKGRK